MSIIDFGKKKHQVRENKRAKKAVFDDLRHASRTLSEVLDQELVDKAVARMTKQGKSMEQIVFLKLYCQVVMQAATRSDENLSCDMATLGWFGVMADVVKSEDNPLGILHEVLEGEIW